MTIRVLVVDDSAFARKLLADILSADPEIEVVGTATNGRIALEKMARLNPDVVTLDIEMPELDGLETLAQIRKDRPKLPVIMCSTLTERGAITTLDALAAGATDYVTKPSSSENLAASVEHVRGQLLRRVKALGRRGPAILTLSAPPPRVDGPPRPEARVSIWPPAAGAPREGAPAKPRDGHLSLGGLAATGVVAIGASTGGPAALSNLLPKVVRDVRLPIVIVQHMPPVFTTQFAARLGTLSGIEVREAVDGDLLEPGKAWVAPGDHHMALVRDGLNVRIALNQGPPENSCRPAVDVLFRSVATVFGKRAVAVVLTGMGQDGYLGARDIRAAGGQVLAQDEATSVVWGMPGAVVRHQLAQAVLPLDQLPSEIARCVIASSMPAARAGGLAGPRKETSSEH